MILSNGSFYDILTAKPDLINWFLEHNLITTAESTLGDSETYVRASALNMIAELVEVHQLWRRIETPNLPQKCLFLAMTEGELPLRKASVNLARSFYDCKIYEEEEILNTLMPIAQHLTEDTDDEIRLLALKIIHKMLEKSVCEVSSNSKVKEESTSCNVNINKAMLDVICR